MGKERKPHDSECKQFFSTPEMVESLLRDFAPVVFIKDKMDAMLEERAAQWKDDYIRQGVLIGRAEGRAEGRVKGKVGGIGLVLQGLFEARFSSLHKFITSYIASYLDAICLTKLTVFACNCRIITEIFEQIHKNDNKLM